MPQFDVFLCHHSRDKPLVREINADLRRRGLRPWLDEEELVPGRPWQEGLEAAIASIRSVAILISHDDSGPWAEQEMRAFLEEFARRRIPVIPVLLPGASERPELPIFLRAFTWVDLRDGISSERLDRLVWGITGIKPGATVRVVDEHARQKLPFSWAAQLQGIGMHNADREVPRLLKELHGDSRSIAALFLMERLKKNIRKSKHRDKPWVIALREAAQPDRGIQKDRASTP
jgi:TIR domain